MIGAWPFPGLAPHAYRVILADPPWKFETFTDAPPGPGSRRPEAHYRTLSLDQLMAMPVRALAHEDGAMLAMWTTFPFLGHALRLLSVWGFVYSTGGAWAKVSAMGYPASGTGYIYRSAAEPWLLGRIDGGVSKRKTQRARSTRNLIIEPPREHSRKPDAMHAALEGLFPGPYCELFARAARSGWHVWGNEIGKFEPQAEIA